MQGFSIHPSKYVDQKAHSTHNIILNVIPYWRHCNKAESSKENIINMLYAWTKMQHLLRNQNIDIKHWCT